MEFLKFSDFIKKKKEMVFQFWRNVRTSNHHNQKNLRSFKDKNLMETGIKRSLRYGGTFQFNFK
jgi:hypothetical protein